MNNTRITLIYEEGDGGPTTVIQKEGVECLEDFHYTYGHFLRAVGFTYVDRVGSEDDYKKQVWSKW